MPLRHGEVWLGHSSPLSLIWVVDRGGWAEPRPYFLTPGKGTYLIVPDSKAYCSHVIFVQHNSVAFDALLRRPNTWKSHGGKSWLWGMDILDSAIPPFSSWACHRHSSWWWYGDFRWFLKISGFWSCNLTFFPILLIIYINLNVRIFHPPTFLFVPCVLHGCGDGCGHADAAFFVVIYAVGSSMIESRMLKFYKHFVNPGHVILG